MIFPGAPQPATGAARYPARTPTTRRGAGRPEPRTPSAGARHPVLMTTQPIPGNDINTRMMYSPELPFPMLYVHGNPGDPAADLLVMVALMVGLSPYAANPVTGALSVGYAPPGWELRLGATTLDIYSPALPGAGQDQTAVQEGIRISSAPPSWEEELRAKLAVILVVGPPLPFQGDQVNVAPLQMLRGRTAAIGVVAAVEA